MSRMYDLADTFVDEYVALDPLAATRLGIAGHDAEISDLSPDGALFVAFVLQELITRAET